MAFTSLINLFLSSFNLLFSLLRIALFLFTGDFSVLLQHASTALLLHEPPLSSTVPPTVKHCNGETTQDSSLKAEWGKVELRDVQRQKRIEITIRRAREEPENSYKQKMFGHLEINFLGQVSYDIAYRNNLLKK